MMWVFAVLIVLAMGGVAMLAAGHGEPMVPSYDDRPDAIVPAHRTLGAGDLRKVRFSLALRGYRMSEVDALLARLASEMEGRRSTDVAVQPGLAEPEEPVRTAAEEWALAHPAGTDILDFSAESVDQVESFLDQWSRRPGRSDAADNEDVWAAGAYVGEILVRSVPGARWVQHPDFEPVPVVAMPSGGVENPIGRARERYEGDEGHSIASYLDATLAAERP